METPPAGAAPSTRASDPIGVFDSGVGGLSVLQALRAELPLERFVYLSDSGHAPYGEQDDAYVIRRSQAVTRYLVDHHRIKALVVACNTATAAAIQQLRQDFSDLPIIGIEPALKPAASQSQTKHIGVLATRVTLNSAKFRSLLQSLQGQAHFVIQPCDGLADAIERDDATKIAAGCAEFTRALGQFGKQPGELDTLVLGCTHYPFANDTLRALVGPSVVFLEGGVPVARQTQRLLAQHGWLAGPDVAASRGATGDDAGLLQLLTTGAPASLQAALQRWLKLSPEVQPVVIG
ncbi:MAG: glutamate racemase [Pseudomonadota bacterium]